MRAKAWRVPVIAALVAAAGIGYLAWLKLAPRVVPQGQPPLATISSAGEIRDAINARSEMTTILALLSPT